MNLIQIIKSTFGRIFHARRIIIVTDQNIDYYPVGKLTQLMLAIFIMGVISLISYSTGSFVAAQSMLAEKDKKIASVNKKTRLIENDFALLRRDFINALENGDKNEISEYAKHIVKQYEENSSTNIKKTDDAMLARITYLEKRIKTLKEEGKIFAQAVRNKISNETKILKKIIKITKIDTNKFKKLHLKQINKLKNTIIDKVDLNAKGGPYIPINTLDIIEKKADLFKSLDEMIILENIVNAMPLSLPIEKARRTSRFGNRYDPITGKLSRHDGLDFAGKIGSKIHASASGKIVYAGWRGSYGKLVEINHGNGLSTRYAHLSKVLVKKNDEVAKNDIIGIEGTTGRSTGYHLHYEVRLNGKAINPANFIKAGKYASKNR